MRMPVIRCAVGVALLLGSLASAQAAKVQIQMRDGAGEIDDYIAWAPVPATIRVSDPAGLTGDLTVVLTDAGAAADCRATHRGAVLFAPPTLPQGQTATQASLSLTLPKSGAPVSFFVAGKYGCPSTGAKDTAIVASTATGTELGRHDIMVRVRKDVATLTTVERDEFLNALLKMKLRDSRDAHSFEGFVRAHRVAAIGKNLQNPNDRYPDQAHGAPAFIAWHRAYLLEFERELQSIDPRVALPYWRLWVAQKGRPWTPFTTDFLGENSGGGQQSPELTRFDPSNPLFGWTMPYDNDGDDAPPTKLSRFQMNWADPAGVGIATPADIESDLKMASFAQFARAIERDPHGGGHTVTGPWMYNCKISPSDPIFWLFHNEHDRLWAEWQYRQGRFGNDGTNSNDYYIASWQNPGDPAFGHYDPTATKCQTSSGWTCPPIGHNLFDTMWPWDGITSVNNGPAYSSRRPPTAELQPFPKSAVAGLWPSAPAKPRPADVIDYAGVNNRADDLGYSYDNVPYGVSPPPAVASNLAAPVAAVAAPPPVLAKLEALDAKDDPALLTEARAVLTNHKAAKPASARAAMQLLGLQMFKGSALAIEHDMEIMMIARQALSHPDPATRRAALALLSSMNDPQAEQVLLKVLKAKPGANGFSRVEAINSLGNTDNFAHADSIRPYLHDQDANVRLAATQALAGDPGSAAAREAILADAKAPLALREAALDSLVPNNPQLPALVRKIASDPAAPPELRRRAVAELNAYILLNHERLPDSELAQLAGEVSALAGTGAPSDVVDNVKATIAAAAARH